MKKTIILLLIILGIASNALAKDGVTIKCLSTTSIENSGLTDYLLPMFEADTGIKVMLIARGTGAALEAGRRGDADVVLVHSKDDELRMVKEGWFVNRRDIMYNDFVLLGPKSDPVGISKECKSVSHAFGMLVKYNARDPKDRPDVSFIAPFISRGDNSGTHKKELSIWDATGILPSQDKAADWYLEIGQGMAKAMRIADEKDGYILADRGTWLALKDKLALSIVFEGDPVLVNQYGVMAVNPVKHPHVKYAGATAFINWLKSPRGQKAIGEFKINSEQLFVPNANNVKIKLKDG